MQMLLNGLTQTLLLMYIMSKLIEACWVCGKFRDEHAESLPMLCSECFHECRIKGFSDPTEDIVTQLFIQSLSFRLVVIGIAKAG